MTLLMDVMWHRFVYVYLDSRLWQSHRDTMCYLYLLLRSAKSNMLAVRMKIIILQRLYKEPFPFHSGSLFPCSDIRNGTRKSAAGLLAINCLENLKGSRNIKYLI
jgi:hypothetical protein